MKKLILFFLIIGLVFILGTCNTPSDPGTNTGTESGGEGEEGIYNWGEPGYKNPTVFGTDDLWPGYELNLADCPNKPETLGDISVYSNVILTAVLYDREGNTFPTGTNPVDLQAQFHILLDGSSGWTNENKLATKDNLVLEGDSSATVTKTGMPGKVLVQAHYDSSKADTAQVGFIEIRKLTFVPKTSDVVLDHIFGSSVTVTGNKLIFDNASYGDSADGSNWDGTNGVGSAALLVFPASWEATEKNSLKDKAITINFTIEEHTCIVGNSGVTNAEHQLNVQAAQNTPEKNLFNGQDPGSHSGVGQLYITLDSADETGYNSTTRTGNITIPAKDVNMLITASEISGKENDYEGPFTLDALRIVNNGTHWENKDKTPTEHHYRCKSYTLVFNSITIAP